MAWQEGDIFQWNEQFSFLYSRGTWWWSADIKNEVQRLDEEFIAYEDDIVLASFPKVGFEHEIRPRVIG